MAESLVDFDWWKTNSLQLSASPPVCLSWPCRVQLIDKGFCPCHKGLMSFCHLPGSPVPHSVLLFCLSSIPDRFPISLPPLPSLSPIPSTPSREVFIPNIVPAVAACKLLSQSEPFLLKSHHQHLVKCWEGACGVNPISFLSNAHTCIRA